MVYIPAKITVDHPDGKQDVIAIPKKGEGLDQGEDFTKDGVSSTQEMVNQKTQENYAHDVV